MSERDPFAKRIDSKKQEHKEGKTETFLEKARSIVGGIRAEAEKAFSRTDEKQKKLESASGLSQIEIEGARRRTHIQERITQQKDQYKRLEQQTLEKIQAAVDLLSDKLSPEDRAAVLKDIGVGEKIGAGAFYDAHALENNDKVWKDLKLNYLFGKKDAVRMLARHEIEAERMRKYFGDMVPDFAFVYPEGMKEVFDKEKSKMAGGGKLLYDFLTFSRIQMDRRLQQGFARRDVAEQRRGIDKVFGVVGELLSKNDMFRKESAGVMIQERVSGMTVKDFLSRFTPETCPQYAQVQTSIKEFAAAVRKFNEKYALLWHSFESDNVLIETDAQGQPTGKIKIIDLNFTEKSAEFLRKKMVRGFEKKILQPLEEAFHLNGK